MTDQPPLPFAPVAGAIEIGAAAALVEDDAGGRVFIHGNLAYAWQSGDEGLRRLAAAQLVAIKAAKPAQVAAGFGVDTATLYRWRQRLDQQGVGALAPGKPGPKGPWRLTEDVVGRIRARRAQGASLRDIGAELDLSPSTVRLALGPAGCEQDQQGQETVEAGGAGQDQERRCEPTDTGGQVLALFAPDDDSQYLEHGGDSEDVADGAGQAGQGVGDDDASVLPVLADPPARTGERALARWHLIGPAAPVHIAAGRVPLAGLFTALPALGATGLLSCAQGVYGALPPGFYGLDTVLLEAVLRTLAGQPRAEGASRIDPIALGRVLGMDRSPEVKTIRRKFAQLAAAGKADALQAALAACHLDGLKAPAREGADEQVGMVLYVDGHVRAYTGKRKIAKTHSPRLKFPAPATLETWVSDAGGGPVLVVMATPGDSLAGQLRALLPQLRTAVGDDRRVLVGFDRGGWSPALFKHMSARGFDVLTWRKRPTEDLPESEFAQVTHLDEAGRRHTWNLAETDVDLPLKDEETFTMRQVTRRDDTGRQAHVLTTRTDLSAAEVIYRMGSRWRQENHFRYGRLHLDLDSHDSYSHHPDDPDRSVPNPAKLDSRKVVQNAQARLERERARTDAALLEARTPETGSDEVVLTNAAYNAITSQLRAAEDDLAAAQEHHKQIPTRVPLSQVAADQQVLETETKLITHAIKMAAFNTTRHLVRDIRLHSDYARADDEAYALARQILTHTGDIDPRHDGVLTIRLDPLPTARATRAMARLCEHLSATATAFPGTDRVLHYEVKTRR